MSDLMVLAFQTDTTRVVTLAVGSDESHVPGRRDRRLRAALPHAGASGQRRRGPRMPTRSPAKPAGRFTPGTPTLFAEMVRKMKDIDEGGSSLLDNCLILYTSYMADGGHGRNDYPAVLVGNAGGTLQAGRHLAIEKQAPVANLYVEMLNLAGVPTTSFGDSHTSELAGYLNGRLPGLV